MRQHCAHNSFPLRTFQLLSLSKIMPGCWDPSCCIIMMIWGSVRKHTDSKHFTGHTSDSVCWCCRLQAQQKEWLALQAELLAQGSVLKAELSTSQLDRTRLEGELSALRENNQSLDLSNARLTSQYQVTRAKYTKSPANVATHLQIQTGVL